MSAAKIRLPTIDHIFTLEAQARETMKARSLFLAVCLALPVSLALAEPLPRLMLLS